VQLHSSYSLSLFRHSMFTWMDRHATTVQSADFSKVQVHHPSNM
jgi:hypothetical protein